MSTLFPKSIVDAMYKKDGFSAWLGIEVLEVKTGYVKLKMKIRKEMLNGFGRCHGGIPFSLADSALAFASNSHGRISVSIENAISYPAPVMEGDELTAVCEEITLGNKIGNYHVQITNQGGNIVGIFRGTVYRTSKEFGEAS